MLIHTVRAGDTLAGIAESYNVPLFLLIFVFLGIGGGFRSVYMITKSFFGGKDTYIDVGEYKKGKGPDDGKDG